MLGAGQPRFTVGARQHHPVQGGEEGEEASEGEEGERRRLQGKGLRGDQTRTVVFGVFPQLHLKVNRITTRMDSHSGPSAFLIFLVSCFPGYLFPSFPVFQLGWEIFEF